MVNLTSLIIISSYITLYKHNTGVKHRPTYTFILDFAYSNYVKCNILVI